MTILHFSTLVVKEVGLSTARASTWAIGIMRRLEQMFCSHSGELPTCLLRSRSAESPCRHGLSYTTFGFSDLRVSSSSVSLKVTNTGRLAGAEVVQVYVAADPRTSSINRPKKELKGFAKIFLEPGQAQRVEIALDRFATTFWDEVLNQWVNEKGKYQVMIGKSSMNLVLEGSFKIEETRTWTGL
jgi:beta-glucosidase